MTAEAIARELGADCDGVVLDGRSREARRRRLSVGSMRGGLQPVSPEDKLRIVEA
jgi:hypothetical protein